MAYVFKSNYMSQRSTEGSNHGLFNSLQEKNDSVPQASIQPLQKVSAAIKVQHPSFPQSKKTSWLLLCLHTVGFLAASLFLFQTLNQQVPSVNMAEWLSDLHIPE